MFKVSMTDFRGAVSSFLGRVSDFVSNRFNGFKDWARRKNYVWKRILRRNFRSFKESLKTRLRIYSEYFVSDFAPVVAAFGLMINFPLHVLLDLSFTWQTVVSWGLVFYFVSEELTSILDDLKPYVSVRVNN